jgi:hypothetical protein
VKKYKNYAFWALLLDLAIRQLQFILYMDSIRSVQFGRSLVLKLMVWFVSSSACTRVCRAVWLEITGRIVRRHHQCGPMLRQLAVNRQAGLEHRWCKRGEGVIVCPCTFQYVQDEVKVNFLDEF